MSILGNVFKIAGTVIEGTGRTIVDCAKAIEESNKEYRESEAYAKNKEFREEKLAEMRDSWNKICKNGKEIAETYKKENKSNKNNNCIL